MAVLQVSQVLDIVNSTLEARRKDVLGDLATDLQRYIACERLLSKKREAVDGGTRYRFDFVTGGDNNAKWVSPYEVNNLDQKDASVYGYVDWRWARAGTQFDQKLVDLNAGGAAVYSFLRQKEYQTDISWFDMMEAAFWDGPSSSSDVTTPYGLFKYWLQYATDEGLTGTNHTNFSGGPAAIDCTNATYGARWKHYTGQYTNVDADDLVAKIDNAVLTCDFQGIPSKPMAEYTDSVGHDYEIYCTKTTFQALKKLLDAQSVTGKRTDLDYIGNAITFGRIPIQHVPYLTTNKATSLPVVGLDWNDIKTVHPARADWMTETPYKPAPNQEDVFERYKKASLNFVMHNRRRHFMFAKSSPISA